jgi:hypothetical protein
MATTPKGTASGTNTATLPTHAAGDKIVIAAYRDGSNTAPTVPAGYVTLGTITGNTNSLVLAMKVAASSSETVGTFTNATTVIALVLDADAMIGAIGAGNTGSGTSVTYGALTCQVATGSTVYAVAGHRSVDTALGNPPSGMTNVLNPVDATDEAALHRTTATVASYASNAVSVGGTSSGWVSMVFEVRTLDNMANWIAARAAAAAGTADAVVLAKGDSLTAAAIDGVLAGNGVKANSFPAYLAAHFAAAPASDASFLGNNNMDQSGISAYDPRITLGDAWSFASGFVPLGAEYLLSDGAGANFVFNPGSTVFDTFDIYYGVYSGGPTVNVTRDGGTAVGSFSTNNATDGVAKSTFTIPSGTHTIELVGTTANAYVLGMLCRSSTQKRVHFMNAGWYGQTSVAYATQATYGAFQSERLISNLGLKIEALGANDFMDGIAAANFRASLLAEAIETLKNGGSIIYARPPYVSEGGTHAEAAQDAYYANKELIASAVGGLYVDITDTPAFSSYANMVAAGYTAPDTIHLNSTGYPAWGAVLLPVVDEAAEVDYTLTADSATVTVAAQAAALKLSRRLAADSSAYAIASQPAALKIGRKISAAAGAVAVSGTNAALRVARKLSAASSAVVVTAQDATLSVSQTSRVMAAIGSAIAISAKDASLRAARRLVAAGSTTTISGTAAQFRRGKAIVAAGASFAISATAATFHRTRKLVAHGLAVVITGQDAVLRRSGGPFVPSIRSVSVPVENRTATVLSENRSVTVASESRSTSGE